MHMVCVYDFITVHRAVRTPLESICAIKLDLLS